MKDFVLQGETVAYQATPANTGLRWDDSVRHLVQQTISALPANERLAWIRADQRQRWQKGFRIPIEAYLELPPLADADADLVIDLIYSEFILRQELGESATSAEFLQRFPPLDNSLHWLFAVDSALVGEAGSTAQLHANATISLPREPGNETNVPPHVDKIPMARIGKYPILDVLAEGGQGIVYRALHPTLGKEVVIKLSKQTVQDCGVRDALLSEGQLLARIDHPNLVKVFDLDFHDGRPFLVMEFVAAVNLEQYHDRIKNQPRRAAALIARIARALDTVHRKGIIHRDIKPRNILVDETDEPKLIDFGLAAWRHGMVEPAANSGGLSGTLAYISPEQACGEEGNVGARSDVFGLGGVLYFLLTGRAPYREAGLLELIGSATKGAWDRTLLEKTPVPERLRAICARALAVNPNNRHASALELAEDLEAYLQRPRKMVRAGVILCMAILGCVLAGWLYLREPTKTVLPKKDNIATENEATLVPSKLLVEVVRKTNGKSFAVEDALPVLTGNQLRFAVDLPANRYGILFHFSEGKWERVQMFDSEKKLRAVSFPNEAGTRVPLEGNPGTEFFLFCARKKTPFDLAELKVLLGDLPAFPDLKNDQAYFTFNEQGLKQAVHRGKLSDPVKGMGPEDLAHRQLIRIRDAVRAECDVFAGVLFVHRAPDE